MTVYWHCWSQWTVAYLPSFQAGWRLGVFFFCFFFSFFFVMYYFSNWDNRSYNIQPIKYIICANIQPVWWPQSFLFINTYQIFYIGHFVHLCYIKSLVIPTYANSYMCQHHCNLQRAYANISLKHTAINSSQKTYIFYDVNSASFG